jgi:1,4-alpha-glucan branching enzyme
VDFVLKKPEAKSVFLAGTFNGWSAKRTGMSRDSQGWTITLWLPPGRYEYKFVVDGQWLSDPQATDSAPNEFGGINSVLTVV